MIKNCTLLIVLLFLKLLLTFLNNTIPIKFSNNNYFFILKQIIIKIKQKLKYTLAIVTINVNKYENINLDNKCYRVT